MKKGLLILGIAAFGINLAGNIILGVKLSQVKEYQESTFVVTYNEYNRSTHMPGALLIDVENTIKEKSLKYVNEYTIGVIDIIYKEGENTYASYPVENNKYDHGYIVTTITGLSDKRKQPIPFYDDVHSPNEHDYLSVNNITNIGIKRIIEHL